MRSPGPGYGQPRQQTKLSTIIVLLASALGFSVGLLAGYVMLGSPNTEPELRKHTLEEMVLLQGRSDSVHHHQPASSTHPPAPLQTHAVASTAQHAGAVAQHAGTVAQHATGAAAARAQKAPARKWSSVTQYCKAQGMPGDTIHVLFTSNGSPYQNIQARIMLGTYRLIKKMPGGEKLVALTRILHRTKPDEFMQEFDTFRADPLQPECDNWCWFPVADRANAVKQWTAAVEKDPSMVKAPWLLMLETDYVWMKPLAPFGSAYDPGVMGMSFAFDYIGSRHPTAMRLLQERCPTCNVQSYPNTGPAPVLMRFEDLKIATPDWENMTFWIEHNEQAKKQLGWVREMYAWSVAQEIRKLPIKNEGPPTTRLISQLPHDTLLHKATMYHYTWGIIYKDNGTEIWKFDKRFYTRAEDALKLPVLPSPPKWRPGIRLQDGLPVTESLHASIEGMMEMMNKGIATLDDLTPGAKGAGKAARRRLRQRQRRRQRIL